MKKRNSATRVVFIVISVLILLSMLLGFVMMVIPTSLGETSGRPCYVRPTHIRPVALQRAPRVPRGTAVPRALWV